MNYQKIYDDLISSRIDRATAKGEYYERHHIQPISMGGIDDSENIVKLTAREHFLAHWLLWRIHRNKEMGYAFSMMRRGRKVSARGYEEAKEAHSMMNSIIKKEKGIHTIMAGKTIKDIWIQKYGEKEAEKKLKERYGKVCLKRRNIQDILAKDRIEILLNSSIDFSSQGWVNEVSLLLGIFYQKVTPWMMCYMNEFWSENCFKRKGLGMKRIKKEKEI